MKFHSGGQTLIEILIAVAIIVVLAVAITGLAALSTRILIQSERKVVALGIANEKLEKVRSGQREGAGFFISGTETLTRNNLPFTVTTSGGGGETRVLVEWPAPGGSMRQVEAVTYVTQGTYPASCDSCPPGTACDLTIGACRPPGQPDSITESFGNNCQTGLLCDDGSICNVNRQCGLDPDDDVSDETNCRPGEDCGGGAICSLSGICPTESCGGGEVCSSGTCFNGYCYDSDWYGLTFHPGDPTGPMAASPIICEDGSCDDCNTCKSGAVYYIKYCSKGWIPQCGGLKGCQGGFAANGSCPESRSLVEGECLGDELSGGRVQCTGDRKECEVSSLLCPWPFDENDNLLTEGSPMRKASVYWGGYGPAGCESHAVHNVIGPKNEIGEVIDPSTGAPVPNCSTGGVGADVGPGIEILMERIPGFGSQPQADGNFKLKEGNAVDGKHKMRYRIRPSIFIKSTNNVADRVDVNVDLIKGDMGDFVPGQDAKIVSCDGPACLSNQGLKRQVLRWEPDDRLGPVTIQIEIDNDHTPEQHENFKLAVARARSNYYHGVSKPDPVEFVLYNDDVRIDVTSGSGTEQEAYDNDAPIDKNITITKWGATNGAPDTDVLEPTDINFDYAFQDITASQGSDYSVGAVSLPSPVFPASSALSESVVIPLTINDDSEYEANLYEEFKLLLNNLTSTSADYLIAPVFIPTHTVKDNEPEVTISNDYGDEDGYDSSGNPQPVGVNASLTRGPTDHGVCVSFLISDGTAKGADYSCSDGTLCIATGQTASPPFSHTCSVTDDALVEGSEYFTATITGASGADYDTSFPARQILIGDND